MRASLPWAVRGARIHLPRDLSAAYLVARMGAVTLHDVYPILWGSANTARFGFGRLVKLGLLRSFEREDPSRPAWYSITADGAEWVMAETGCDAAEIRIVTGIRRMNVPALRMRNRFWTSLALGCRAAGVELTLVRPEFELRRIRIQGVPIVPDMLVALTVAGNIEQVWMVEFDSGTERSAVLRAKAQAYRSARQAGSLFGAPRWQVLFVVPSQRRAGTVAAAAVSAGAGVFTFLTTENSLAGGQALNRALWVATDFANSKGPAPRFTLLDAGSPRPEPSAHPDQRGPSAVDRPSPADSGEMS